MKRATAYYLSHQNISELLKIFPEADKFKRFMTAFNIHFKMLNENSLDINGFQAIVLANAGMIGNFKPDSYGDRALQQFLKYFLEETD